MEKLKLIPNTPEVIALEFTQGRPVSSSFGGDQVLYTLADGRQMYLSPFVAAKIDALNFGKGEPFRICKRETVEGNRRKVDFEVSRLASPAQPPIAQAGRREVPSSAATPQHHELAQVAQKEQPQANTHPASESTHLDLALRYAIDAAAAAEQYAKTIDYALRFTSEDIRAMALSKFIAMDRNPGGNKWNQ